MRGDVETVRVEVAVVPRTRLVPPSEPVRLADETTTDKFTIPVKLPTLVTVIVDTSDEPTRKARLVELASILKSTM